MPAARTSSTSTSPVSKRTGAPKAKGAVRAKSGCYTCRIRRKKCDEQQDTQGHCSTCVRLRLECLGFGAKRPDWLRENRNVVALRDKIKQFLGAQGMIKGHSSAVPRSAESGAILRLSMGELGDNPDHPSSGYHSSSSSSPPTHTQPIPPNNVGSSGSSSGSNSGDEYHPVHRHPPTSGIRGQWTSVDPSAYGHDYYHRSQSPADSLNMPYQTQIPPSPHSLALRQYHHRAPQQLQLQYHNLQVPHEHSQENDIAGSLSSPATRSRISGSYNIDYSGPDFQEESMNYAIVPAPAYHQQQQASYPNLDYLYYLDSGTLPQWMSVEIPFTLDLSPTNALDHYIRHVVGVQYLLETPSVRNMITQSVNSDDRCREAVTLLADVHWLKNVKKTRTNVLESNDLKTKLRHLEQLLSQAFDTPNFLAKADATMAALHLVSVVLFDGGKGAWRYYLALATKYVHDRMTTANRAGETPLNQLKAMSEKEVFIVKTTIWFDVLASVTSGTPPTLLYVVRKLFGPNQSGVVEVGGDAARVATSAFIPPRPYPSPRSKGSRDSTPHRQEGAFFGPEKPPLCGAPFDGGLLESNTSMMSPMGCENGVVWAIAEISALAQWKDDQRAKGQLSYPDLVMRAQEIERELDACAAASSARNASLPHTQARRRTYPPSRGCDTSSSYVGVGYTAKATAADSDSPLTIADFNHDAVKYSRYLTAHIFRASATLYLHAVVSGGWPHVREIQHAVKETLKWIKHIPLVKPHMPEVLAAGGVLVGVDTAKQIAKTVIRSTVFGFYICGALADEVDDFRTILEYLETEGREMVGNISSIVVLLQEVWNERETGGEVMWRRKLHPSPSADPILLV